MKSMFSIIVMLTIIFTPLVRAFEDSGLATMSELTFFEDGPKLHQMIFNKVLSLGYKFADFEHKDSPVLLQPAAQAQITDMEKLMESTFEQPFRLKIDITRDWNDGHFDREESLIKIGHKTESKGPLPFAEDVSISFAVVLAHEYGHAVVENYFRQNLKTSLDVVHRLGSLNELFADIFAAIYFRSLSAVNVYTIDRAVNYVGNKIYKINDLDGEIPDHIDWPMRELHQATDPARSMIGYYIASRLNSKATPRLVLKATLEAMNLFDLAYERKDHPFTWAWRNGGFVHGSASDLKIANQLFVDLFLSQLVLENLLIPSAD